MNEASDANLNADKRILKCQPFLHRAYASSSQPQFDSPLRTEILGQTSSPCPSPLPAPFLPSLTGRQSLFSYFRFLQVLVLEKRSEYPGCTTLNTSFTAVKNQWQFDWNSPRNKRRIWRPIYCRLFTDFVLTLMDSILWNGSDKDFKALRFLPPPPPPPPKKKKKKKKKNFLTCIVLI